MRELSKRSVTLNCILAPRKNEGIAELSLRLRVSISFLIILSRENSLSFMFGTQCLGRRLKIGSSPNFRNLAPSPSFLLCPHLY